MWINAAAFSVTGEELAVIGRQRQRVWDARKGEPRAHLHGHTSFIVGAAFSRDRKRVASWSYDRTVRVWNAGNGRLQFVLAGHADRVQQAVFSPDGCKLFSAGDDKTVRVWSVATTAQHQRLGLDPACDLVQTSITDGVLTRDGKHAATAGRDGVVRIWDLETGKPARELRFERAAIAVAFSPDGRLLAIGTGSTSNARTPSRLSVYDWRAERRVAETMLNGGRGKPVSFSPDGGKVLVGVGDGSALILPLTESGFGAETKLQHGTSPLSGAALSPNGRLIATSSNDREIRVKLWDVSGTQPKMLAGHGLFDVAFGVAWTWTKDSFVTVDGDAHVLKWTWNGTRLERREIARLEADRWATQARFSPDDRFLFLRRNDGALLGVEVATGHTLFELEDSTLLTSFDISADGSKLLTTYSDGATRIAPFLLPPNQLADLLRRSRPACSDESQKCDTVIARQ